MTDRDPRFDGTKREQARELYEGGASERAVAEAMGLSRTRVRRLLAESGAKRRRRGRPARRQSMPRQPRGEPR